MAEIITFYSYKGGTGRSMAVANVAWILASRKKRVLVIDWDLEAPGLHRYFAPFLVDRDVTASRGVIDFIREFAVRAATPQQGKQSDDWYLPYADLLDYAVSIKWPWFAPGMLDFVPAGQQDASYATRVNSFSWEAFYDKLGGGAFLEAMKRTIRDQYDYILIDSRTGVSDTSGICTVQMPDTVVVCFTLNNQSIKGASSVAKSIAAQRTDESGKVRVRILPVATRVDTFEKRKVDRRRAYAKTAFQQFLQGLPGSYWNDVEVPYWSFYAYEECLAAFGDEPGAPNSLLRAFEGLASHVTNGEVKELIAPPAEERERVLVAFEEIPGIDEPAPLEVKVAPASAFVHDLYLSWHYLDDGDAGTLTSLLEGRRLYGFAGLRPVANDDQWAETVKNMLRHARAFAFCEGRFGLGPWQKRELALAFEHQRVEAAHGHVFPIVPVLLPQANPAMDDGAWLYSQALDLRRRIDDATALDGFARTLLAGELRGMPADLNPWKGSAPYGEKDSPLFFGRDEETRTLAALAAKSSVLFLTGTSGSGKTSLINAGLLPALRRQAPPETTWEVVRFRPESSPFQSLMRELISLWSLDTNETGRTLEATGLASRIASGTASLHSVLNLAFERPPRTARLLIVVDQAEDVFLKAPRETWAPFFRQLHAAAENTPTTVLIAIRPEWEQAIQDIMPEWTWVMKNPFVLRHLGADRLRQAIAKASALAGRPEFAPRMTEPAVAMLNEPGGLLMASRALHRSWPAGEPVNAARLSGASLDSHLAELPELQRAALLGTLARLVQVRGHAA